MKISGSFLFITLSEKSLCVTRAQNEIPEFIDRRTTNENYLKLSVSVNKFRNKFWAKI